MVEVTDIPDPTSVDVADSTREGAVLQMLDSIRDRGALTRREADALLRHIDVSFGDNPDLRESLKRKVELVGKNM